MPEETKKIVVLPGKSVYWEGRSYERDEQPTVPANVAEDLVQRGYAEYVDEGVDASQAGGGEHTPQQIFIAEQLAPQAQLPVEDPLVVEPVARVDGVPEAKQSSENPEQAVEEANKSAEEQGLIHPPNEQSFNEPAPPTEEQPPKINVNSATEDQLSELPLTDVAVKSIIENRPYTSVEEIPEKAQLSNTIKRRWEQIAPKLEV